jgi:hypothetical protein
MRARPAQVHVQGKQAAPIDAVAVVYNQDGIGLWVSPPPPPAPAAPAPAAPAAAAPAAAAACMVLVASECAVCWRVGVAPCCAAFSSPR